MENNNENVSEKVGAVQNRKKMSIEATLLLTIAGTALFIVILGLINYIYTSLASI